MNLTRRHLFGAAALLGAEGLPLLAKSAPAAPLAAPLRGQLWTSYYEDTRVWGYVDRHSVKPGETFNLMLSTGPNGGARRGTIEIFRLGPYGTADRKLVKSFKAIEIGEEAFSLSSAAMGLRWPTGVDTIETGDWASGYYTIDFIDDKDGNRDLNVAFIIVRPANEHVDVLLVMSTNTFQAYNAWGGASLYESIISANDGAYMVSFDRPTPPDVFEYEYFLIIWLETLAARHGWSIGYATNFDIHGDEALTRGCRLLVSGSHNEYWSKEEFDHVYRRIFADGRNTIFFGANSAYWQVRYLDINGLDGKAGLGRQIVCYKSVDDPIATRLPPEQVSVLKTAMFRDEARRPETMLAGVAYQNYFSDTSGAKYPYHVCRTDLPFFEGTNYKAGDSIGDIVGYEWDNRDPEGDGKRLWDAEKSKIALLPADRLHVLFEGHPVGIDGKKGLAEAVYFTSPAGARVFSTGSIRWAWGLGKPGFESQAFRRFNENLFTQFLS